ncbi:MAG: plastocyanin/azurin family copper-binding protein [Solirubrobacterales bacterium]
MHAAVLHLAPILGAEKSKVPFYVAGGALVVWALVVSLGMGMRIPNFPRNAAAGRGVIAVTAVLVLAAVSTAVITSGGSTPKAPASTAGGAGPSAQAPVSEGTPTAPAAAGTKAPIATTGTSTPPSSPAAAAPLKLAANPEGQLSYEPKQLSAKAGKVMITMANSSPVEHNVTVAQGSTVLGATPTFKGGSKTLTLNLKPGKYTFYCSVPGHRQAGMEGTLTIS